MKSVLQDWVMDLPLRAQGTILTGIRGCDLAPKHLKTTNCEHGCSSGESTPERQLVAFVRYCVLNPADPREVDYPGAWFQSKGPLPFKPSALGHYPLHWYSHLMHTLEVIAYMCPDHKKATPAYNYYCAMVHMLHLNIESEKQMHDRLMEDRIANGTVVS